MATGRRHNYAAVEDWRRIPGLQRFCHEAMATVFEILIVWPDADYACRAARAAFSELDGLEAELSRFIDNSDISRVNAAPANQPVKVGLSAFTCLRLAERLRVQTDGAFDVTIGELVDLQRRSRKAPAACSGQVSSRVSRAEGILKLNRAEHTVRKLADGAAGKAFKIDLGGIGKGYALDWAGAVLRQWGLQRWLIHSGGSTILALKPPAGTKGWPVSISYPVGHKVTIGRVYLRRCALSCSGVYRTRHIIDPRTARPVKGRLATWVRAPSAALADGLSTAFMVMTEKAIAEYCTAHPRAACMLLAGGRGTRLRGHGIRRFGTWDEFVID
jgi:thiamine biosynthesis lipoprotein